MAHFLSVTKLTAPPITSFPQCCAKVNEPFTESLKQTSSILTSTLAKLYKIYSFYTCASSAEGYFPYPVYHSTSTLYKELNLCYTNLAEIKFRHIGGGDYAKDL